MKLSTLLSFALLQQIVATTPAPTTSPCGNLAPCYKPNGDVGSCYNLAHEGCCDGTMYLLYNTQNQFQFCCHDASGSPYISSSCAATPAPTTAPVCGHLAPCNKSDGTLGGCYNMAHEGCCDGLIYLLFDYKSQPQTCCHDGAGKPYANTTCSSTPAPTTAPVCGHLAPCNKPDGTLGGCYNMAHEGCCDGLVYLLFDYKSQPQTCCHDGAGKPYANTSCPTTATPTTSPATTLPTTTLPATTTPATTSPATTLPTITTAPPQPTKSPSTCTSVSVAGDATYCIQGPICSGNGILPAGTKCPLQGTTASADCHSYLKSYVGNNQCTLSVNTTCAKIPTGAWGCVLPS